MKKIIKWIMKCILTLIGIFIANGLWASFGESLWHFWTEKTLNFTTFGIETFKDKIYLEIAKGFCERPSLMVLTYIMAMLLVFIIIALIGKKTIARSFEFKKLENVISKIAKVYLCISIFFIMILITRVEYVNKAIIHFGQLINIISPYVDDPNEEKYRARFAQIRSRNEYYVLINELETIAKENKQYIPKFDIW